MKKVDLKELGLREEYINESNLNKGTLYLARVSIQHKDLYKVITENGEILAEVSGKFRHETYSIKDFPAVGDWVLVDRLNNNTGNAIIQKLLDRKSCFERKVAGRKMDNQVIAANIDTVFICMALNNNFNVRRLERYISVAWDSGADPVVVLTKADLCKNIKEKLVEVEQVAIGINVIITSSVWEEGYKEIKKYLVKGKTVALIGSSGVGKSTMINKLLGSNEIKTTETDSNDKGRHTTTYRQLFLLEGGGILIDTPGMRELGIVSGDIEKGFSDIEELEKLCKFSDCRHESEPGCAVRKAIEDGRLTKERFKNYKKIQRELIYNELGVKAVEKNRIMKVFGSVKLMEKSTRHIKNKKVK